MIKMNLIRSLTSCDETMYLYRLEDGELVLVTSFFDVCDKTWSWEVYFRKTSETFIFVSEDEGEGLPREIFKAHLALIGR